MNKSLLGFWVIISFWSKLLYAQVFVSETNYFDKETECIAIEIRGHSTWIKEAIVAYAKKKQMESFWTKFFYISFQNVELNKWKDKASNNKNTTDIYYRIHFKLSPTKMDSLHYLYLLVQDVDNNFLLEKDYASVYKSAREMLLEFSYYYQYIFLLEKALQIAEKNYSDIQMRYAWLSEDSTKVINNLLNDTTNLFRALQRSKDELKFKDSSFRQQKFNNRQELRILKHRMDSLKTLRLNNLKKYPL